MDKKDSAAYTGPLSPEEVAECDRELEELRRQDVERLDRELDERLDREIDRNIDRQIVHGIGGGICSAMARRLDKRLPPLYDSALTRPPRPPRPWPGRGR